MIKTGGATTPENLRDYTLFRAQFKTRMQELSDFYEQNIDDPKVHFLEKLRLKLKAALMARLK